MIEWLSALALGKWVVSRLAGGDENASVVDVAGKFAGNLVMSLLGTEAKTRWTELTTRGELRPGNEPLNHYIEQAYRMAELSSLVLFVKRAAKQGRPPADAYTHDGGRLLVESLSSRHRGVRENRQSAYAEGLDLDHLALALSSMSDGQWAQADAQALALRRHVEDRALEELEWACGHPASPAFAQLFRDGGGPQLPPWFGLLTHSFVHVLLQKDKHKAQESLMLRLVSRTVTAGRPDADLADLEAHLKAVAREQPHGGVDLGDRLITMLDRYGQSLGSDMAATRADLQSVMDGQAAFREAWEASHAILMGGVERIEASVREQSEQMRKNHAELLALLQPSEGRAPGAPGRAHPAATAELRWSAAQLPPMPEADGRPIGRDAAMASVQSFVEGAQWRLLCVHGREGAGKTTLVSWVLAQRDAPTRVSQAVIYLKATEVKRDLSAPLLDALDRLLAALDAAPVGADQRLGTLAAKLERIAAVLMREQLRVVLVLDSMEVALDPATGRLMDADLEELLVFVADGHAAIQLILVTQQRPRLSVGGRVQALLAAAPQRILDLSLGIGVEGPDARRALLRSMLGGARPELARDGHPTDAELDALLASVGGNPNAVRHVALALADDPLLTPAALSASVRAGAGGDVAADAVREALIGRYFPKLSPAQQALLCAIAVLGGSATLDAALAVAQAGALPALRAAAANLLDRHLLRLAPQGDLLAMHDTEKAFYLSTLDVDALRAAYARAADHWQAQALPEARWRSYADAAPSRTALSMQVLAGDAPSAAARRHALAQRLFDIGLVLGAAGVLEAAGDEERRLPTELARLRLLAVCRWKVGAYDEAQSVCAAGLALADARDVPPTQADVLALRQVQVACEMELGRAGRSVEDATRLLADLEALGGSPEATAMACRTGIDLAFAQSVAGRQDAALASAQRALTDLDVPAAGRLAAAQRNGLRMLSLAYLGLVHSYRGEFVQARRRYAEASALAAADAPLYEHAIVLGHCAELDLIEGRVQLSMDRATRALELEAETDAMSGSWCNWLFAMALLLSPYPDRVELAENRARAACRFTRLLNDPNPRVLLGILLLLRGQRDAEAVRELERALATVTQLVAACPQNWEALVARGMALLVLSPSRLSSVDEALEAFRAAHAASPHVGHFARIELQMRLAEPILAPAGIDIVAEVASLYGVQRAPAARAAS